MWPAGDGTLKATNSFLGDTLLPFLKNPKVTVTSVKASGSNKQLLGDTITVLRILGSCNDHEDSGVGGGHAGHPGVSIAYIFNVGLHIKTIGAKHATITVPDTNGILVGSRVLLRGIEIGHVTDISQSVEGPGSPGTTTNRRRSRSTAGTAWTTCPRWGGLCVGVAGSGDRSVSAEQRTGRYRPWK